MGIMRSQDQSTVQEEEDLKTTYVSKQDTKRFPFLTVVHFGREIDKNEIK